MRTTFAYTTLCRYSHMDCHGNRVIEEPCKTLQPLRLLEMLRRTRILGSHSAQTSPCYSGRDGSCGVLKQLAPASGSGTDSDPCCELDDFSSVYADVLTLDMRSKRAGS